MCAERLALYTTIYPGVEPYLAEWFRTVDAQTDREFDLWIGLDTLSPADVAAACGRPCTADWVRAIDATPAEIRSRALETVAEQYAGVILVDSDDLLHPSRVSAARRMLREVDVAACALELLDPDGRPLDVVLAPPAGTDAVELLPRYNVFGFSNTAYRSAALRQCLPFPADCALIDWLLATRAWSAGATLAFDPTPRMGYRQHPAGMAPVLPPFGEAQVLAATGRVLAHYDALLDRDWPLPAGPREALESERTRVAAFDAAIRHRPELLPEYVDALNRLQPARVWWWLVANPKLEAVWNC